MIEFDGRANWQRRVLPAEIWSFRQFKKANSVPPGRMTGWAGGIGPNLKSLRPLSLMRLLKQLRQTGISDFGQALAAGLAVFWRALDAVSFHEPVHESI